MCNIKPMNNLLWDLTFGVGEAGAGGGGTVVAKLVGKLDSSNKPSVSWLNQLLFETELEPVVNVQIDGKTSVVDVVEETVPDVVAEVDVADKDTEDLVGGGGNFAVTGGGANESPNGSEGVIRSICDMPCCMLFSSSSKSKRSAIASEVPSERSLSPVFLVLVSLTLLESSDIVLILLESAAT